MSREIKFRGKTYDGRWVFGDLSTSSKPNIYVFPSGGMDSPDTYLVIPETVGQFTGLRDDNGKEVYEGDVIQNLLGQKLIVEWNDDTCKYKFDNGFDIQDGDTYGVTKFVVGNIYDNPELLK